jgi:hypothetical protein
MAATFIQSCWQRLLARKELQRLQKEAKELSIQLIGDSRTNHLEESGMIRSKQGKIGSNQFGNSSNLIL